MRPGLDQCTTAAAPGLNRVPKAASAADTVRNSPPCEQLINLGSSQLSVTQTGHA